ncbi:MAG: amino acid ABC transporter permease, partial [Alphaproteobacteria bacterium]
MGSLLSLWQDEKRRAVLLQALAVVAVLGFIGWVASNTISNLEKQNLASGFDFMDEVAGFGVTQSLIDYSETSTYGRAFWVGLLNTLLVAVVGVILATVLGFVIGVGRLSSNWLVRNLSATYVELIRNVPLLLQIFFWYFGVLKQLPSPKESIAPLEGVFLNIRGLYMPRPVGEEGFGVVLIVGVLAIVGTFFLMRWARLRQQATGQTFPAFAVGLAGGALLVGVTYMIMGAPLSSEMPQASRFNVRGGMRVVPEFVALVLALSIYTASFIAEIVRSGIEAVPKGQWEAAQALGLSRGRTLRLVVIPQALRVIVPPLTSQYLNLTKNSSLAVAIGYMDIVATIGGISLNQTGREMECMIIVL